MSQDNRIVGQVYIDGVHKTATPYPTMKTFERDSEGFYPLNPDPVIEPLVQTAVKWHKDVDNLASLLGVEVIELGGGELKDSGERREFTTGAVRDASGPQKGAPHLRPIHALNRLDVHMSKGAKKYAARNWEKGIPLSVYCDSAQRHLDKAMAGYIDEDHMAAALWNVSCYLETEHRIRVGILPKELNDMPTTFAALQPEF